MGATMEAIEETTVPVGEGEEVSETQTPEDSWSALDESFDGSDAPEFDEEEEEPKAEETEPAPADDAPELEEPAPSEEQKAEEVVEEPKAEEPKVEEAPPEPPRASLTEEQRAAMRSAALESLTREYQSAITEEDAELLATEPEKVLPKLAAEVQLRVFEQVVNTVAQGIPQMIQRVNQQTQTIQEREGKFFEEWPTLREHKAQVTQIAQMWRQMNPRADTQTAIREIGRITSAALGLTPETPQAEPQAQAPSPAPVVPSSPPAAPARSSRPMNPFEALADAWEETEDDYL